MAKLNITAPDGKKLKIETPDRADGNYDDVAQNALSDYADYQKQPKPAPVTTPTPPAPVTTPPAPASPTLAGKLSKPTPPAPVTTPPAPASPTLAGKLSKRLSDAANITANLITDNYNPNSASDRRLLELKRNSPVLGRVGEVGANLYGLAGTAVGSIYDTVDSGVSALDDVTGGYGKKLFEAIGESNPVRVGKKVANGVFKEAYRCYIGWVWERGFRRPCWVSSRVWSCDRRVSKTWYKK